MRHIIPKVSQGQSVQRAQVVAQIVPWRDGGPHVHLEVWKTLAGGYNIENFIDPGTLSWNNSRSEAGASGAQGGYPTSPGAPSAGELVKRIDALLRSYSSPLAGTGDTFVSAGSQYAIAPAFLVGIAAAESTYATGTPNAHARAAHNPFGMLTSSRRLIVYGSWEEAIRATAANLRNNSAYSGKTTVDTIGPTYVGHPSPAWYVNVKDAMSRLGFNPAMRVR
jgi:hypothetical protein